MKFHTVYSPDECLLILIRKGFYPYKGFYFVAVRTWLTEAGEDMEEPVFCSRDLDSIRREANALATQVNCPILKHFV